MEAERREEVWSRWATAVTEARQRKKAQERHEAGVAPLALAALLGENISN